MKQNTRRGAPRKKSARAETVDDYLAAVPADARAALTRLRKTVKAAAPNATEVISYRIPMYRHQGPLVSFAAFTDHCSFFIMSPAVTRRHAADLKEYTLGKATIQFPASQPLPATLVTKLVKARIVENETRRKKRKSA